MQSTFIY